MQGLCEGACVLFCHPHSHSRGDLIKGRGGEHLAYGQQLTHVNVVGRLMGQRNDIAYNRPMGEVDKDGCANLHHGHELVRHDIAKRPVDLTGRYVNAYARIAHSVPPSSQMIAVHARANKKSRCPQRVAAKECKACLG